MRKELGTLEHIWCSQPAILCDLWIFYVVWTLHPFLHSLNFITIQLKFAFCYYLIVFIYTYTYIHTYIYKYCLSPFFPILPLNSPHHDNTLKIVRFNNKTNKEVMETKKEKIGHYIIQIKNYKLSHDLRTQSMWIRIEFGKFQSCPGLSIAWIDSGIAFTWGFYNLSPIKITKMD